jgi:hypothetical protein
MLSVSMAYPSGFFLIDKDPKRAKYSNVASLKAGAVDPKQ